MNWAERIALGYARIWFRARERLAMPLLAVLALLVLTAFVSVPLALVLGLAGFVLTLALAWLHGDRANAP